VFVSDITSPDRQSSATAAATPAVASDLM
jgi:hypothetical protein